MARLGFALPLTLLLLPACGPEEAVLQGVPSQAILGERPSAASRLEADPSGAESVYARPDGVFVDVQYLGGRPYQEHRDVIVEQLGPLQRVEELPAGSGKAMHFERGSLRVEGDIIYMVLVPFPEPLRRSDALVLLGFPPQADRYVILHREYRLNNAWGFRRIRLKRLSADTELVTEVEAWQRVPGEPSTVR